MTYVDVVLSSEELRKLAYPAVEPRVGTAQRRIMQGAKNELARRNLSALSRTDTKEG